jgi:hypothetical protein
MKNRLLFNLELDCIKKVLGNMTISQVVRPKNGIVRKEDIGEQNFNFLSKYCAFPKFPIL